mgnify:FL=1
MVDGSERQAPMERYHPFSPTGTLEERRQQALAQCDHLIQDFAQRASRHKARYKRLQVMSVTLAISTTILAALSAGQGLGQWEWIVPAMSGLATLATTLLSQTSTQNNVGGISQYGSAISNGTVSLSSVQWRIWQDSGRNRRPQAVFSSADDSLVSSPRKMVTASRRQKLT